MPKHGKKETGLKKTCQSCITDEKGRGRLAPFWGSAKKGPGSSEKKTGWSSCHGRGTRMSARMRQKASAFRLKRKEKIFPYFPMEKKGRGRSSRTSNISWARKKREKILHRPRYAVEFQHRLACLGHALRKERHTQRHTPKTLVATIGVGAPKKRRKKGRTIRYTQENPTQHPR